MNIVAIESSTNICSVSSFKDTHLINVIETEESKIHTKVLPVMIQTIMSDFKNYTEIDAFAVSIGPGSFTSLRISLSLVKGLAFGLKNNIIPVPTLESLNFSIDNKKDHYIILDSFKDKFFIQKFKGQKPLDLPFIGSIEKLKENKTDIYGYSTKKIKEIHLNRIVPNSILIGEYAIKNKIKLLKQYNSEINPIYLSDNKYIKINDSKSK